MFDLLEYLNASKRFLVLPKSVDDVLSPAATQVKTQFLGLSKRSRGLTLLQVLHLIPLVYLKNPVASEATTSKLNLNCFRMELVLVLLRQSGFKTFLRQKNSDNFQYRNFFDLFSSRS